jgi:hypothetical protein
MYCCPVEKQRGHQLTFIRNLLESSPDRQDYNLQLRLPLNSSNLLEASPCRPRHGGSGNHDAQGLGAQGPGFGGCFVGPLAVRFGLHDETVAGEFDEQVN